ncbi:hypothetical protein SLS61_002770 [Didymella pomorum]
MPIRNPFRRAPGAEAAEAPNGADNGFRNTAVSGAKPLEIKDTTEYKLSALEINDSGVYLPPSPQQEKPTFWHSKSNVSTTSSNHRSLLAETEPFNISRESFDSYRRSFQGRPSESTDRVPEEGFEDVGLNDEPKPAPKKRGIFSRFGDNNNADNKTEERPSSGHHFSLTGRKRAESGKGEELKPMGRPSTDVPVETR